MGGINGINGAGAYQPQPQAGNVQARKDSPEEMKKALEDFEALFINQMLTVMRESVGKGDLFHGGSGEDIYTSLFDTELSKLMSKNGGMGLSNMLMKQFGMEDKTLPEVEDLPYQQEAGEMNEKLQK